MKLSTFLLIAGVAVASPAFGDADWRAISPYGPLATIHTTNIPQPHGKWLHTAKITPLVMDLGVRLWCNGVELPTYGVIDDPVTARFIDNQESANWEWRFNIDPGVNVPSWIQKLDQ
jgi:hypothetical protein